MSSGKTRAVSGLSRAQEKRPGERAESMTNRLSPTSGAAICTRRSPPARAYQTKEPSARARSSQPLGGGAKAWASVMLR